MHALDTSDEYFDAACRILSACQGRGNAITIDALAERAGIPHRRIAEHLLETRLADFPFVLVSGPRGYFIPTAQEAAEINRYLDSLESRFRKMWRRRRTVIRKALTDGFRREGKAFVGRPMQAELFEGV